MEKRSILITGCSSGIGHAAAHGLQSRGWRVFATARKATDVARLRTEGFEAFVLDLNDSRSIQTTVTRVLEITNGKIDALFNNGGYGQPGAVEDLTRDTLRAQMETNLFGHLELTNLVIPVMRSQGNGRIINNGSILGLIGLPFRGAYVAAKFALKGLTDTLRLELRGTGIHVSLLEPGPIRTQFRGNALAALERSINIERSFFRDSYLKQHQRLASGETHEAPFTLDTDAVLKKLIHALEAPNPKAYYRITVPAIVLAWLRCRLGPNLFDRLLSYLSTRETRFKS